jgi:cobalt-zinc-cadmium efflux system membrane fusion protein
VIVHIYEEDLWALRALKPEQRVWKIDLKTDPFDNAIAGTFELIGSVIDPNQHTGVVMGWLDNSLGNLSVGQFVTASIVLPCDKGLVSIPDTALIEEGDRSMVFVQVDDKGLEFERRKVSVARRQAGLVLIKSHPSEQLQTHGIRGLAVGETIIKSRVLGLGSELDNLQLSTPLVTHSKPERSTAQQ